MIVVIIGVSGSGKSTIGTRLAEVIGCPFLEGDTLHPAASIDKMSRGIPLDDDDRRPWLSDIHARIVDADTRGQDLVVACSALKDKYRRALEHGVTLRWVYLKGSDALFRSRLKQRTSHFMKADMLASQFQALEEPSDAIVIDAAASPDTIVARIHEQLVTAGATDATGNDRRGTHGRLHGAAPPDRRT